MHGISANGGSGDLQTLDRRAVEIGRQLLAKTRAAKAGALSKQFWKDKLIAGALENERFKTELFRFVDVFPVLKTGAQVHGHLSEYLDQPGVKVPTTMSVAMAAGGLLKGMFAKTIASQITGMAENFIAGSNVRKALPALESRWKDGIAFSVDILGEACVSHTEATGYQGRYRELIETLPGMVAKWPVRESLERDHLGVVPRVNVSIKISALDGHVSPVDTEGTLDRLTGALGPLLELAGRQGVHINFDMEQSALKELTFKLFKRCCERFKFDAGLAVQAYLRSAEADAKDLVEWARSRGRIVTVRLIKGAYWDYETINSEMMHWPSPVWSKKPQTDACFERVTSYLIEQLPREGGGGAGRGGVKLALGTHNVRSIAWGMAAAEAAGLPKAALEFQALRGMAEESKEVLAADGWRIREYAPIGEMIPGMAYLVRRLLENTSNEGWLRMGQGAVPEEKLLAAPRDAVKPEDARVVDARPAEGEAALAMESFVNEPPRDFSLGGVREAFGAVMGKARLAPVANDATEAMAQNAVALALKAYPAWRDRAPAERARILVAAAAKMRAMRDTLSAEMVLETHKIWAEADADVCEAIDFCEYYARQEMIFGMPRAMGNLAGESNALFYEGRGVAAIISPWNFPLAICMGMTVAALVAGNTAIVKPAEQSPAIARRMCGVLWEAGVPREALHFLPGRGEVVGAALVRDPRVSVIAFTGSKEVGLQIVRTAGETPPEQLWVKRVICEMGGKNATIVDESADLDEAVLGVRQSAFGYAGQKCSAGSRVVVLESIHDAFVKRLVEATRALKVGDPIQPATDVGPVIDDEAAERIRRYVEIGKQEATLVYPDVAAIEGLKDQKARIRNLIEPHLFVGVLPRHRIAREEIFGPILAIMKAKDFDEALALANDSVYKLTGGLFSRTPSHLERARREFRVGNLYLNRGITGAIVGRQPFGGFGLSGVGSKAGGPEYLLQFTDARAVTENLMRRGFAPERE